MIRQPHWDNDHCRNCDQRITDRNWLPFCCEICWDSSDAFERRLWESGALDDPHNRQVEEAEIAGPEGR